MGFQLIWTKTTDATFHQTILNFSSRVKINPIASCTTQYLVAIT
jgi:hypothetical protein